MSSSSADFRPTAGRGTVFVVRRLLPIGVVLLSVLLVFPLMEALFSGRISEFMVGVGVLLTVLWTFWARDMWWVAVPAGVAFGGGFYFGVRILAHEVALLLCLLPLIPRLALRTVARPAYSSVPWAAYGLIVYLVVHLAVSAYLLKVDNCAGLGRVLRVYMHGLWPLLFLVPFLLYGSTSVVRKVVLVVYWVILFRVIMGAISYFHPSFLHLPGINYVLPTTGLGAADLRGSALLFTSLSLCFLLMARSWVWKTVHLVLIAAGGVMILLSAGRGVFLAFCSLPMILAGLRRQVILPLCVLAVLVPMVVLLNLSPDVLYRVPVPAQRALSVLILDQQAHKVQREASLSTTWHFELGRRALEKWTASVGSFVFGNRVYPYVEEGVAGRREFATMMIEAERTGAYEAGLWTVLAVTGIVGCVLYILVFWRLLKGLSGEILRHGISDYAHVVYFVAVSSAFSWAIFCWIMGHFPSAEIMWAAIAHKVYEDKRQEMVKECAEEDGARS